MNIFELDLTATLTTAKDVVKITAPPSPADPHLPRGARLRLLRAVLSAGAATGEVLPVRLFKSLASVLGNPGFARYSNFDVANATRTQYINGGVLQTLSASTVFDTGTGATIAADKWGVLLLSLSSAGVATGTWATAAGAGYNSEALAIAAMPATPTDHTVVGYVTVKTAAGQAFTAGTSALKAGTGGNPASETNYYAGSGTAATPSPRSGGAPFAAFGGYAETALAVDSVAAAEIFRKGVELQGDGFEWQHNPEDILDLNPGESVVLRLDAAPAGSTAVTVAVTVGLW